MVPPVKLECLRLNLTLGSQIHSRLGEFSLRAWQGRRGVVFETMNAPIPCLRVAAASSDSVTLILLDEHDEVLHEKIIASTPASGLTPEFTSTVQTLLREWLPIAPDAIRGLAHDWALTEGARLLWTPVSEIGAVLIYLGDDVSVCAIDKGATLWRSTIDTVRSESAELGIRQRIAAAAVCLDRLDAVIFTGADLSEHSELRKAIIGGLGVLGIHGPLAADPEHEDAIITDPGGSVPVLLVTSREEQQIAQLVRDFLI
jgi:Acetokinase family